MQIINNVSLRPFNTFNVDAQAAFFCSLENADQIAEAISFARNRGIPMLILGGGSNILFTRNFEGLVVRVKFRGITRVEETPEDVWLEVQAGTDWETLIDYCVENHYCGLVGKVNKGKAGPEGQTFGKGYISCQLKGYGGIEVRAYGRVLIIV